MSDPSVFGNDPAKGRNEMLYGGDGNAAMYNALLDSGINPLKANPFTQMLLKSGAGLQLAARMKNLGMTPDQATAAGGGGAITKDFMTSAINSGNVFDTLAQAGHNAPNVLNQVNAITDAIANHQMDASQANPFAEMLQNAFGDPGHFQQSMASLYSPALGGQLGSAYSNQIGDIANAGYRQEAGEAGTPAAANANFWNYVFRNTQRGQRTSGAEAPGGGPSRATSGNVE